MPLTGILGITSGCPTPDLMDGNPPTGSGGPSTPCYQYATDVATAGYTCGLPLQPTCSSTCTTNGGGTDSTSDCSAPSWVDTLLNVQSHMWVSSPLTANMTLTGDGALTAFSQVVNSSANAHALVSFCIELYDIPPTNGVAGSLADILLAGFQPAALGGAAYVPPTDAGTGSNWPSAASQTSFGFHFLPSNTASVTVAAGHRLGIRIWVKVNLNAAVDVAYDNPNYPASLQLNSQ
jgi:hypothetical protein